MPSPPMWPSIKARISVIVSSWKATLQHQRGLDQTRPPALSGARGRILSMSIEERSRERRRRMVGHRATSWKDALRGSLPDHRRARLHLPREAPLHEGHGSLDRPGSGEHRPRQPGSGRLRKSLPARGRAKAQWIDLDSLIEIKSRIDDPRHQEDARVLRLVRERRGS